VPEELQELYSLYFGELNDASVDQIFNLHTFVTNPRAVSSTRFLFSSFLSPFLVPFHSVSTVSFDF